MKLQHPLSFTFSLLLLCGVIVFPGCRTDQRRPSRYLIPDGYVGWIRVDFQVKDAPALLFEDNHYLFNIPPSGQLSTSSNIDYGWSEEDDFYYYSPDKRQRLTITGWGAGGMIWGQSNGSAKDGNDNTTAVFEHFFVGTEEQFKKCGGEIDKNGVKVGPLNADTLKRCMQI